MFCPSCLQEKEGSDFVVVRGFFEICSQCWDIEFGTSPLGNPHKGERRSSWIGHMIQRRAKSHDCNFTIGEK